VKNGANPYSHSQSAAAKTLDCRLARISILRPGNRAKCNRFTPPGPFSSAVSPAAHSSSLASASPRSGTARPSPPGDSPSTFATPKNPPAAPANTNPHPVSESESPIPTEKSQSSPTPPASPSPGLPRPWEKTSHPPSNSAISPPAPAAGHNARLLHGAGKHAVSSRRFPALPRPLARTDHSVPQQMVHSSLITPPITFQPIHDVRVQTHRHRLLCRPVEPPHLRPAPVHHLRHLRQINVCVFFSGDAGDLALLLFCELPHSFSSPCWSRHERR
jgi:hypothetical protein